MAKAALPYPLVVPTGEKMQGRTVWEVRERFEFRLPLGEHYHTFAIPPGTTTDFASIPRFVWPLVSPDDPQLLVASLIHDQLYKTGGRGVQVVYRGGSALDGRVVSRFFADVLLREVARLYGASVIKRVAVYYVVRVFGGHAWRD